MVDRIYKNGLPQLRNALVIIGLIPVAVNYLWWHRQYAKTTPLPLVYLNYTPVEKVVLLILVVFLILGLLSVVYFVM